MRLIRSVRTPPGAARRPVTRLLTAFLLLAGGSACATWGTAPLETHQDDGHAQAGVAQVQQTREERMAAARKWGLDRPPLVAPPPPKVKPQLTTPDWADQGPGLIPVFASVPTEEKVVFLTIDDGAAKDHAFLQMLRDLDIPVTAFLTDESAADDYGYFRDLHAQGASIQNHTLHHPQMITISEDEQRAEVCGQQDILQNEIGVRPWLFRPPFGDFDAGTLAVAEECGARAAPLWNEEAFPDRIDYREDDPRFHPGDIILTHFNGPQAWNATMPDMLRTVLREATEQGYALARLEDYI
ncbi:polysaccharide deacetylase family protein [Streptomyces sp. NPDC020379]|uniref:polysaccharide deacetylase family protein n=1 Tax=Streptomyces sp. NPDC020379 TaxID=3365071 RepID=UPI00379B5F2F